MGDALRSIQDDLDTLHRISPDELRSRQDCRLAEIVRFHFKNERNGAYRELLRSYGIEHESELPRTVDDLSKLPTITRRFLEDGNYAEKPCVAWDEVRKVVETSGTSGNPLRVPHTHESMRKCDGEFIARSALLGGMNLEDHSYAVVHWVAGGKDDWASYQGTRLFQEIVGSDKAMIVSTHTTPAEHLANLQSHAPRWAFSTPVFFLSLTGHAEAAGVNLANFSIRRLLLAGATGAPEDLRFLQQAYGLDGVHFLYASTESFVPAAELPDRSGYVCFEDECIVEVLDDQDRPVDVGERGRAVITVLGNRGYPGIRYVQGDAVTLLGRSSEFPACTVIGQIQRIDSGEIGDARLPYSEIELMPRLLLQRGIPVRALQIARQRNGLKDVPIIRIETSLRDRERIEREASEIFARNVQVRDMLDGGLIHPPVVEIYPVGALSRGRLKVPVYLDERAW